MHIHSAQGRGREYNHYYIIIPWNWFAIACTRAFPVKFPLKHFHSRLIALLPQLHCQPYCNQTQLVKTRKEIVMSSHETAVHMGCIRKTYNPSPDFTYLTKNGDNLTQQHIGGGGGSLPCPVKSNRSTHNKLK
jgi:hypothetical protein